MVQKKQRRDPVFPLRTPDLCRLVRCTQRKNALSLNCDPRKATGGPGESYRVVVSSLIGPASWSAMSCSLCGRCRRHKLFSNRSEMFLQVLGLQAARFPRPLTRLLRSPHTVFFILPTPPVPTVTCLCYSAHLCHTNVNKTILRWMTLLP